MRRLPIYFVLDCSESMVGEPIAAVENGLLQCYMALRRDSHASESAYISVITFGSTAKQVVPLTELTLFQPPKLVLGSGTALGAALELLEKRIDVEVTKTTHEAKGDYKPLVFLLTDGEPTDRWEAVADRFMKNRSLQLIAVGCGQDANPATLRRITECAILGGEANQETFAQFFQWVSASVATASQAIDRGGEAKLPFGEFPHGGDLQIVDNSTPIPPIVQNRFIFLHCRCVKKKQFYLMKFEIDSWDKNYYVSRAFPLDDFEQITEGGGVTVSTSQLHGNVPCPYCGDQLWAMCSCGKVHCCPIYQGSVVLTCPWCGITDTYGAGSFDLGGGGG